MDEFFFHINNIYQTHSFKSSSRSAKHEKEKKKLVFFLVCTNENIQKIQNTHIHSLVHHFPFSERNLCLQKKNEIK